MMVRKCLVTGLVDPIKIPVARRRHRAGAVLPGPRGKFRCTFTAKFYRVLWLIEHCCEKNAIDKGKLLGRKLGGLLTPAIEFKNL